MVPAERNVTQADGEDHDKEIPPLPQADWAFKTMENPLDH